MRKMIFRIGICFCISAVVWGLFILRDRTVLHRELIRLHVVANSDSHEDQAVKLLVRDAILDNLRAELQNVRDKETAIQYLRESIPKLQTVANSVLEKAGFDSEAAVSFCKEAFPVRHYDTFSLPSGVYDTLRITIGQGSGKNWWCVTFPSLCLPATSDGFHEQAVSAGFSKTLSQTLTNQETYHLRFYLLDRLGQLENFLFENKNCQIQ